MANSTDDLIKQLLTQTKITNVLLAEMMAPTKVRPVWCEQALAEISAQLLPDDQVRRDHNQAKGTT